MTRRTFTTSMMAIGLLAVAALIVLYMTLGQLQAAFESARGNRVSSETPPAQTDPAVDSAAGAATPGSTDDARRPPPADLSIEAQLAAQGLANMTLTPAGRAELMRLERKREMAAVPKRTVAPAAPGASPKPQVDPDATATTKPSPEQTTAH